MWQDSNPSSNDYELSVIRGQPYYKTMIRFFKKDFRIKVENVARGQCFKTIAVIFHCKLLG
jgi:hypothetical protein